MLRKSLCCVVLGLCFSLFSAAHAQEINIAGSSTIQPIVKKVGKMFKKETGIKVIVKGGGSGLGVKSAEDGSVDIGTVSRVLKDSEPKDLVATTIALDGIAIIVNSANSLNAITKQQVVDIYTGKISNWKELGGQDKVISVESKTEGRSTKELFEKFFDLKGKVLSSAHEIGSNAEAIAFVSGDPDSIGYVSVGTAEGAVKNGIEIRLLYLDGVKASVSTVADESYPLRRPLNLVTKGEPAGVVKQFIDYVLSPVGQQIVKDREFVRVR